MAEGIDYEQLLADLKQERDNIERLIVWVEGRMQQSGSAEAAVSVAKPSIAAITRFPRLAPDSFFRMTVPQAIKTYLNIVKRPQKAKVITEALNAGGLTHQAKDLYATVYPTLLRMEGAQEVVRIGKGEWGLSEWYAGRKPVQEEKAESEK